MAAVPAPYGLCPKHNSPMKLIEMRNGKTICVCPACVEADTNRLNTLFAPRKEFVIGRAIGRQNATAKPVKP